MNNISNQTTNPLNNYQMTSSSFLDNQNPPITYVFYLPLPNRVYCVAYSELNSFEIAQLLNYGVDASTTPNSQLTHHQNVQQIIHQEIQQQFQQRIQHNQQNQQQTNDLNQSNQQQVQQTVDFNQQQYDNST